MSLVNVNRHLSAEDVNELCPQFSVGIVGCRQLDHWSAGSHDGNSMYPLPPVEVDLNIRNTDHVAPRHMPEEALQIFRIQSLNVLFQKCRSSLLLSSFALGPQEIDDLFEGRGLGGVEIMHRTDIR